MTRLLQTALILTAAFALAGCDRSEDAVTRTGQPDYLRVPEADPAMEQAVAEARRTVPQFLGNLRSPAPSQHMFAVKVAFVEGGAREHIWLDELRYDGKMIHGLVSNEPMNVKGVKLKDQASVAPSAISDWMFIDNGRLMGGYTIRLLLSRASPEEQGRLKAQAPFRVE